MTKKSKTFRLPDNLIGFIENQSKQEGISQADLLENAVNAYKLALSDEQKKFMDLFNLLCDNIQSLELKRDYDDEGQEVDREVNLLSDDEQKTLDFYNQLFDEMRKQPLFYEPKSFLNDL